MARVLGQDLPVLVGCRDARMFAANGDEVEVDFESGEARNLTTGAQTRLPGMPPILRNIVSAGGAAGALRAWLDDHPELLANEARVASLDVSYSSQPHDLADHRRVLENRLLVGG